VPLNSVVLEFDPILRIGEAEMRLETVALAIVLVVSLLVAALIARATSVGAGAGSAASASRLRLDDLLFITMGALPGAVVGGRLGYVLLHLDYYSVHPAQIVDPAYGSLELTVGVVGGVLTAAYVLRLLGAPVGRWAGVAVFPLLLVLGAGKLVLVLGGDGQGIPADLPWATSYGGDGPWGSLGPEIPAHPAQVYEGLATLLLLLVMIVLVRRGMVTTAGGSALLVGLGLWGVLRALVAVTWRDALALGPLKAEQVIALTVAAACGVFLLAGRRRWRAGPIGPGPASTRMAGGGRTAGGGGRPTGGGGRTAGGGGRAAGGRAVAAAFMPGGADLVERSRSTVSRRGAP
jgi:phosphatidylglycerol:prolipoprotein diacylglycerol transferase